MKRRLTLSAVLAALVFAAPALAQPPKAPPGPPRDVPPALFISPAGEPFRGPYMDDGLRQWFVQADTDHDRAISLAEFQADHARFFALTDARHDGRIDGFDVAAYEASLPELARPGHLIQARRAPQVDRNGKPVGEPILRRMTKPKLREGAARFSLLNEVQPLRVADADLDFRVSQAEWTAMAARRFRQIDANGDGRLVKAELVLPAEPRQARHNVYENCPYCDMFYIPYVWPYPYDPDW